MNFFPSSIIRSKHAAYVLAALQTADNWRLGKTLWGSVTTHFTPPVLPSAVLVDQRPDEAAVWIWPGKAPLTVNHKSWQCSSPSSCMVKCFKLTWKFSTSTHSFREASEKLLSTSIIKYSLPPVKWQWPLFELLFWIHQTPLRSCNYHPVHSQIPMPAVTQHSLGSGTDQWVSNCRFYSTNNSSSWNTRVETQIGSMYMPDHLQTQTHFCPKVCFFNGEKRQATRAKIQNSST